MLTLDSFAVTGLFRARASDLYGITAKSPRKLELSASVVDMLKNMVQFNSNWLVDVGGIPY